MGWIEGETLGTSAIHWYHVATQPVGELWDRRHLIRRGDFDWNGRDEILVYNAGDGDWWLIKIDGDAPNYRQTDLVAFSYGGNRKAWRITVENAQIRIKELQEF